MAGPSEARSVTFSAARRNVRKLIILSLAFGDRFCWTTSVLCNGSQRYKRR